MNATWRMSESGGVYLQFHHELVSYDLGPQDAGVDARVPLPFAFAFSL